MPAASYLKTDDNALQGAPEAVLARCTHAISNAGGHPVPLTDAARKGAVSVVCLSLTVRLQIRPGDAMLLTVSGQQGVPTLIGLEQVEALGAAQALRCLALASKAVPAQQRQVRQQLRCPDS